MLSFTWAAGSSSVLCDLNTQIILIFYQNWLETRKLGSLLAHLHVQSRTSITSRVSIQFPFGKTVFLFFFLFYFFFILMRFQTWSDVSMRMGEYILKKESILSCILIMIKCFYQQTLILMMVLKVILSLSWRRSLFHLSYLSGFGSHK